MLDAAGRTSSFRRALLRWGRANRRDFPWRRDTDPFRILIAEVLLQRSRGVTVAKVYERLFARWPDARALATAQVRSIEAVIRPLGLTSRAKTIKALAARIAEGGPVPRAVDELMALPGVGPYAANATAAVAFGRRSVTVDGVSARVYRRVFGLAGERAASDDVELWDLVEQVTPRTAVREWNWAVLDLASNICLPKVPRCDICPLRRHCAWSQAHRKVAVPLGK